MNRYILLAYAVNYLHSIIIALNTISVLFMIYYAPWYFWMPFTTIMLSPIVGEERCILNQIESILRVKGGLPPLEYRKR